MKHQTEEHKYKDCHVGMALQQVKFSKDDLRDCIEMIIETEPGNIVFQSKFYDLRLFQLWATTFAEFSRYAETMRWHGFDAACEEADLEIADLESFSDDLEGFFPTDET